MSMSSSHSPPNNSSAPRRSQREKKVVKPFGSFESSVKRKRVDSDTEEDPVEDDEDEEVPQDDEEDEDEEEEQEEQEYHAPAPKSNPKPSAKPKKSKTKGPPAPKKPRTTTTTAAPKPTTTRKPRKPKTKNGVDAPAFDAAQIAKETRIKDDNPIFNAILNPSSPLQTTAEDFLESLSQNPAAAQAELINFILRACGCNDSVDADEVMDYDGIVDALDGFTEGLKKHDTQTYPLTSRHPPFHSRTFSFRTSLSEFLHRTITTSASLSLSTTLSSLSTPHHTTPHTHPTPHIPLYTTPLLPTLQAWIIAMSSSQVRSVRHTATVVALEVEGALCGVAAGVEREGGVVERIREGERKRAGKAAAVSRGKGRGAGDKGRGGGDKGRDKELELKAADVQDRLAKLREYLSEFIDGVFVHRYRDLDPQIRADCVRALGRWFVAYPSHFLLDASGGGGGGAYLRYVGWVLSDANTMVRVEAVRALVGVYNVDSSTNNNTSSNFNTDSHSHSNATNTYVGQAQPTIPSSLNHFTQRFKPRLIEMALRDTDVGVRVAVIGVLGAIDAHGLLEDGEGDGGGGARGNRNGDGNGNGLLGQGEGERDVLCRLVFDAEPKVRKAVGGFVGGVWEEAVDERVQEWERGGGGGVGRNNNNNNTGKNGKKGKVGKKDKQRIGIKVLAQLLVKWGRALDRTASHSSPEDSDDEGEGTGDTRKRKQTVAVAVSLHDQTQKGTGTGIGRGQGRTALAVDALWDSIEAVRDWEGVLGMLVLDHSPAPAREGGGGRRGRRTNAKSKSKTNGKDRDGDGDEDDNEDGDEDDNETENGGNGGNANGSTVDEAWRLEEVEESVLLEVLVASLRRAGAGGEGGGGGGKKTHAQTEDPTSSPSTTITRELIKALPQLFLKHQTDQKRIADVLLIPCLMGLDLYLEMRMISAYANLWDDITKQLLSHSSLPVLKNAATAIHHLMSATSPTLTNTNSTKILELEDELSSSLRHAVSSPSSSSLTSTSGAGVGAEGEIEKMSFTGDEVLSLSAICCRLNVLVGIRDMTAWMEESEGGKQSCAWDILGGLVERGRLGYKEEELMIDQALNVLTMHLFWKAQRLNTDPTVDPNSELVRTLGEQRDSLVEKLVEYAVGTQSNTVEGIKRAAFQNLMNIHILFCASETLAADGSPLPIASLKIELEDEVQYRCAGFIQAEIERYAEDLEGEGVGVDDAEGEKSDDEDDESGDESDDEPVKGKGKKGKNVKNTKKKSGKEKGKDNASTPTRSRLEKEYIFIGVMATFLRAICANVIHVRHGAIFLAHYGRLGPTFDTCSKAIVDVLRDEGMYKGNGEVVATVVTQALQEAFTLVLDDVVHDETHAVALAKLFNTAFVVRGSQLSILRRLDSQYVVEIHTTLLTWIGKRLAAYQVNKNKKSLKKGVLFFRVLLPLLVVIQSRDALRIKAHMDQVLAQAKVEISPTSKIWDPQRAYEKRLATAMAKDKVPAPKGRKPQAKGAVTSEEEGSDGEKLVDETNAPEPPVRPKPRPRRATRARPAKPAATDDDEEEHEDDDVDPATPKAKPRPRATYKVKTPTKPQDEPSRPSPAGSATMSEAELDEPTTPQASRKRVRSEEPEEEGAGASNENENEGQAGGSPPQPTPATPVGEIQIRRKRARH